MVDRLSASFYGLIPSLVVLAAMVAAGVYVVQRWRGYVKGEDFPGEDGAAPIHMINNFREMTDQGHLSEKEYRTIQAILGDEGKSPPTQGAGTAVTEDGPKTRPMPPSEPQAG